MLADRSVFVHTKRGTDATAGSDCNAFMQARKCFLTLLDKPPVSMNAGRWHEFEATWTAPEPRLKAGQP
jgi:hypothetical protein